MTDVFGYKHDQPDLSGPDVPMCPSGLHEVGDPRCDPATGGLPITIGASYRFETDPGLLEAFDALFGCRSLAGTASVTNHSGQVLFSEPQLLRPGDRIEFSPQPNVAYDVACVSSPMEVLLAQKYTGPTNPAVGALRHPDASEVSS